jgi:hypothetical protein
MKRNDNLDVSAMMIAQARFAACVAETVLGEWGMTLVKKSLNRLPFDELIRLWAGVFSLLGGHGWIVPMMLSPSLRRKAFFLRSLILVMPWPSHEVLRKKVIVNN